MIDRISRALVDMPSNALDLPHALKSLENGEFVPYFQPIVTLRTGQLAGFEVLVRWIHPTLGMVLPDDFIPCAERDGWIGELTEKLMEGAFKAAKTIPEPLSLAINISTIQLSHKSLPMQIKLACDLAGFSLHRLVIEITESALTDDVQIALSVAKELKAMGCRIALDDFGTGYSNLLQLQSLPFDELKVDKSFVGSMNEMRQSRKIVSAIIGLGQSLGLTTLAEGVETAEQAEMLLRLGCELAQGWFYGRPSPACDLPGVILASKGRRALNMSSAWECGSLGNVDASPAQRTAHLQAVYDGAPVGLALLDCNLRYSTLNQKLADMNGASVAEHLGSRVEDMVPKIFPSVEGYLHRALEGEAITDVEATVPASATSAEETRLVSYQPAVDEAGEVVGVSIAVVDITDRKLAEQTLHESEEHYRSMVELNPQVLWVMDAKGRNLDVSPRSDNTTKLLTEHTLNHCWLDSVHPDDLKATTKTISRSLRKGTPIEVEYRAKQKAGGWRWMRSCGSPRFDAAGKIIYWYGSVEDIDDLKCTEELLRKSEAKLEALTQSPALKTRSPKSAAGVNVEVCSPILAA